MSRRREMLLMLAAILLSAPAGAAAPSAAERIALVEGGLLPPVLTETTRPMRLAERMKLYRVPGLSVAVVDKGRLAWAHAWGVAQVGQPERLTPGTLMQAASISKSLTALGAFKLADQGRLPLDADVNTLLRRWQLPAGAQTTERPVTARGLLGHTAGLTVHGFQGYVPGAALPTLVQLLDGEPPANSPAVRAEKLPGSEWRYSGGGYMLLQMLMEDVTGEAFAPWMRREVLEPAGMTTSLFGMLPHAPLTRAAAGHMGGRVIPGRRANKPEQAAGGLWTTPSDLARLSIALQRVLGGEELPWLSAARLAQALQPALPDAPTGLGFFVEDGGKRFGHGGVNAGFESQWRADGRRAVIVMANANDAMPLIDEVIRAVAAAHGWTDMLPPRVSTQRLRDSFAAEAIYLRGSMNGWGVGLPLAQTTPGRFMADVDLPAGPVEFKFASQDWQRIDLGAAFGKPGALLGARGPNLRFDAKRAGRYRFTLDVRDPATPRYSVQLRR